MGLRKEPKASATSKVSTAKETTKSQEEVVLENRTNEAENDKYEFPAKSEENIGI